MVCEIPTEARPYKWRSPNQDNQQYSDLTILIPCESHLTFAYDPFVVLIASFYAVHGLPVAFGQFRGNDAHAPGDV